MKLQADMRIMDVQEQFHQTFPGLKIVFYKKEHKDHEGSKKGLEYENTLTLAAVNPAFDEGELDMNASQSVQHFETQMEDNFGFHVQVFRRSNQLWLQTVATDNWTLEVQNRKGIHSTTPN